MDAPADKRCCFFSACVNGAVHLASIPFAA